MWFMLGVVAEEVTGVSWWWLMVGIGTVASSVMNL